MLTKENRELLNDMIKQINFYDRELDALIKNDNLVDREVFETVYNDNYHRLNMVIDDFNTTIDKIWYNNMDMSVQKSLNYYIKKSGLTQRKITAII